MLLKTAVTSVVEIGSIQGFIAYWCLNLASEIASQIKWNVKFLHAESESN